VLAQSGLGAVRCGWRSVGAGADEPTCRRPCGDPRTTTRTPTPTGPPADAVASARPSSDVPEPCWRRGIQSDHFMVELGNIPPAPAPAWPQPSPSRSSQAPPSSSSPPRRPGDYDAAAALALHDRARYTDGRHLRLCHVRRAAVGARLPANRCVLRPARARPGPVSAGLPARPHAPAARGRSSEALPAAAARRPPPRAPAVPSGIGANARARRYDTVLTRHQTPPSP
jgi:hypothetical protein